MIALVLWSLLWGIWLGWSFRGLWVRRPAIHLVQGEIELAAAVVGGGVVEAAILLGVFW